VKPVSRLCDGNSGAGISVVAIVFAALLLAIAVPTATATPPARSNFAFDWPAIRHAAQAFDPAAVARFEVKVEELMGRPSVLIQPVPEPYVGLPAVDVLFFDALLGLLKPHLDRGEVHKVVGFLQAFNKGRLAYAIESSRNFSGCILLNLTLEISDGVIVRGRPVAANGGEYVLVVWSKPQPPAWCRHHDRYSGYKGGYQRRLTGVWSADANPVKGSDVPQTAVADIQRALAARGGRPGSIDGLMGRKTREAIRQFQKLHGLEPDGVPTTRFLQLLHDSGTK